MPLIDTFEISGGMSGLLTETATPLLFAVTPLRSVASALRVWVVFVAVVVSQTVL
jgi:hypothetical protein